MHLGHDQLIPVNNRERIIGKKVAGGYKEIKCENSPNPVTLLATLSLFPVFHELKS
jgi:hypothetical protein